MKRYTFTLMMLCSLMVFESTAQNSLPEFFTKTDQFLNKYVKNGLVNYKGIKKNFSDIQTLYDYVGSADLASANANTKKAFYLNAYNLITIYYVSKHYPLSSKVNESGFFREKHLVSKQSMSLDYLEHRIIRAYKDPRIHFALVCAAKGSPKMTSSSYKPAIVDKQLEEMAKKCLNDPNFIRVDQGKQKANMPLIFKWYATDFVAKGQPIINYLNKFRSSPIPGSWQVDYYDFSWELNEL